MTQTPPGWYPDTTIPGQQRYWDGARWTEHTAPLGPPSPTPGATSTQGPPKQPGRVKKIVLIGAGALVVLVGISAALSGGSGGSDEPSTSDEDLSSMVEQAPDASEQPADDESTDAQPEYTASQESAIRAAEQYLDLGSGFSRRGLIEQLSSPAGNDFPRADAVFAVNHVDVDYNEQAVLSAKAYMDLSGFSRSGLIEQLSSSAGSKFTRAQAEYAADQVGLK